MVITKMDIQKKILELEEKKVILRAKLEDGIQKYAHIENIENSIQTLSSLITAPSEQATLKKSLATVKKNLVRKELFLTNEMYLKGMELGLLCDEKDYENIVNTLKDPYILSEETKLAVMGLFYEYGKPCPVEILDNFHNFNIFLVGLKFGYNK